MALTVKAHLYEDWVNEPIESRRFALDQDVATSYTYLTEKLARTFTNLKAEDITVSYLDSDGDRITVSSDEELTDALDQFDGTVFRLHIIRKRSSDEGPFVPPFMRYGSHPRRGGWCRPPGAGWGYPRGRGCPYKWQRTSNQPTQNKEGDSKPMEEDATQHPEATKDEGTTPGDQTTATGGTKSGEQHQGSGATPCGSWQQGANPWAEFMGGANEGRPFNWEALAPLAPLAAEILGGFLGRGQPGYGCGQQCGNTSGNQNEGEKMETAEPTEAYKEVLEQLKAMGFTDEGSGWLYELVKAKGGDLQKILDTLQPPPTHTDN